MDIILAEKVISYIGNIKKEVLHQKRLNEIQSTLNILVQKSDENIIKEIKGAFEALGDALITNNEDTKLTRLKFAEEYLLKNINLNSTLTTDNQKNSYWMALANYGLAIICSLRKDDLLTAKHLLKIYELEPYKARKELIPELFPFFEPEMQDIFNWHIEKLDAIEKNDYAFKRNFFKTGQVLVGGLGALFGIVHHNHHHIKRSIEITNEKFKEIDNEVIEYRKQDREQLDKELGDKLDIRCKEIAKNLLDGKQETINLFNKSGRTWKIQKNITTEDLKCVRIADKNNVWILSNKKTVFHTADGGSTWNKKIIDTDANLNSIYVFGNYGWIVGGGIFCSGTIFCTTNEGNTWEKQTSGTTSSLYSVYFVDKNNGWAVGINGEIIHTIDGGNTWNKQKYDDGRNLVNVYFVDKNNGWAVGSSGEIIHTIDGGNTWNKQISGTNADLNCIYFVDKKNGWTAGGGIFCASTILHTADGGNTWEKQIIGRTNELKNIYFIDNDNGWAVGGDTILSTINGGNTWEMREIGISEWLTDIYFIDATEGWAVGCKGNIVKYS